MSYLTFVAAITTRLSVRGQVVIPAAVRRLLRLEPGDELSVEVPAGQTAVLLSRIDRARVDRMLTAGYAWLEKSGNDPVADLHAARARERRRERDRRRS